MVISGISFKMVISGISFKMVISDILSSSEVTVVRGIIFSSMSDISGDIINGFTVVSVICSFGTAVVITTLTLSLFVFFLVMGLEFPLPSFSAVIQGHLGALDFILSYSSRMTLFFWFLLDGNDSHHGLLFLPSLSSFGVCCSSEVTSAEFLAGCFRLESVILFRGTYLNPRSLLFIWGLTGVGNPLISCRNSNVITKRQTAKQLGSTVAKCIIFTSYFPLSSLIEGTKLATGFLWLYF